MDKTVSKLTYEVFRIDDFRNAEWGGEYSTYYGFRSLDIEDSAISSASDLKELVEKVPPNYHFINMNREEIAQIYTSPERRGLVSILRPLKEGQLEWFAKLLSRRSALEKSENEVDR